MNAHHYTDEDGIVEALVACDSRIHRGDA